MDTGQRAGKLEDTSGPGFEKLLSCRQGIYGVSWQKKMPLITQSIREKILCGEGRPYCRSRGGWCIG